MGDEAAQSYVTMDPQTTINEVVNSVKSEGLFDQFRKECLEEFENMVLSFYFFNVFFLPYCILSHMFYVREWRSSEHTVHAPYMYDDARF